MATTNKKKKNALDDVNSGIIFPSILSKDMTDRIKAAQNDDIAPVRTVRKETTSFYEDWAPIRTVGTLSKDDKKERKWFNQGLFEDGWQAGDIAKTILGTATDLDQNVKAGVLGIGEKVVDAAATGIGALGGALGNDKFKAKTKDFIAKDLYDEHKFASNPMIASNPFASISKILRLNADDVSVLGEKSDDLAYSGGQLLGTVALQGVGVPWFVTTGATSFGSEVEAAFQEGANYKEAALRGGISAGADILTEKLTGGIKFGGKALDDALLRPLTQKISNKVARNLVNVGLDATGEGFEEVMASVANNLGEKLYNEDAKIKDLLFSEQAMDEYIESFIGGFVLGGGAGGSNAVQSIKTGRDYKTGLTDNEQKVVDAEVQKRIAEQETDGKKLTKKEKTAIEEEVRSQLEKGGISIDSIESALGGDTYNNYKALLDEMDEYTSLNKMKAMEMTGEQSDRLAELKEKNKRVSYESEKARLKEQLSQEVDSATQSDTFLRESYNEKARKGQAYEVDLTKYKSKEQQAIIQKAIDSKILNNTRRTHEFVDMISKIAADKGVSFDFTNNEKLKESGFAMDGKTVNGYVQGNNISLNIQSAKSLNKVVGHEITHVLEGTELYNELQTVVKQYAETKGEYATRLKALEKLYEGVADANIENELTADLIGDYLFTDEKFINNLSTKNPNVFKKIYEEIKYLVKVATAGTKEAKELERIKRIFEKAYKGKSANRDSNQTFYSIEIDIQKEIESFGVQNNLNDYIAVQRKIVAQLDLEHKTKPYYGEIVNKESGMIIEITRRGIKETFSNGSRFQNIARSLKELKVAVIRSLPKIIEEAHIDTDNNKNKYGESAQYAYFKTNTEINGVPVTIRFDVKKTSAKNKFWIHYIDITKENSRLLSLGKNQDIYETENSPEDIVPESQENASKLKEKQLEIVLKHNPMRDDYHTGIRSVEDILTFDEALNSDDYIDYKGEDFDESYPYSIAEKALSTGKIMVYSSYPIEQGVFVSPSYMEAQMYSGNGQVYSKEVALTDVAWIDPTQGQIAVVEEKKKASLSKGIEDIAPIGNYNVYGKDIALEAPIRSDIPKSAITDAPIRSDIKPQTDWDEDDAIFGTYSEENVESPFENRDIKDVGKRNINAYQYDNPEVKPYFQFEAEVMLWDLQHSSKGERIQTGSYDTGQDWTGVKRATSPEIETLLDDYGYSYDDIEKGLNAIIKDNGAENIAVAKRIEFILDERLRNGYTDFTTGDQIEPNQEYLDLFKTVPAEEDIAPVKEPKTDEEIARVLDIEPKTANQRSRRKVAVLAANILDKGLVFENLSLKTRNRKLQSKYQAIKNAESSAQWLIGNGDAENGVKSLDAIREEVGNTGLTREFYEYMYHKHNVDRMSLADRYENMENKPVFGKHVTADISQKIVEQFESQHPEFTTFANEVYTYNRYLRQQLVDNGVISQETADLWEEMYPHYIPTRRVDSKGLNINVPLDSRRTGINAPIKRAIGGNTDILPLFDTMGMRTLQTFKATAKNSFGVELKNTLGTVLDSKSASVDEVIENLELQDELLQKGKNGGLPSFTVFENGERVTFEITEEMYDAMKPAEGLMSMTFKPTNFVSNLHRGLLTEYNPVFMLTNGIKDVQDVLINSQHPVRTYRKLPEAYAQIAKKGYWYNEYMKNGGGSNSYFDNDTNTFKTSNKGIGKVLSKPPFSTISALNNFIEMAPRLAEYIASREAGQSKETAMLDAARVTTNFKAGGDLTKFLNRNGATFLNASVQGAMQQVRNIREAQANGVKGWAMLATKFAIAGVPAMILNGLIWDDDEEYEELSDYVKQNYHILWKTDDGQFIRIPKGRTVAVIEDAMKQVVNLSKGNDEADLRSFLELVITNLAPNNPIENNILAPIMQVKNNETWYGEDMVPTRLQDLPKAEQYDESTDALSRKLGEALNVSPIKINYLLDQYSGGVGDMVLPMFTPQAESGNDRKIGALIAPLKNKFVTDGVINNQNVADFYDMSDELTTNAKMSTATDKDILMNKYMNSVSGQMSELYKRKREIQNSDMKNSTKYDMVRAVQEQIVELSKEGLNNYSKVKINGNYATVGGLQYKKNDNGEWQKLTDEQIEKQEEMTRLLNISPSEFWSADEESMEAYNWAYQNPEKHTFSKSITDDVVQYRAYASDLYNIKADKDSYGKSISGTRKKKVASYINGLDIPDEAKYILFKSEYPSDDSHNMDIINYLNDRDDISAEEMRTILLELDFKVDEEGYITW